MSYLEIEHTFEGFVKKREKKNSFGTVRGFKTMFKLFDNFCLSTYQKGMHQVISDIQANPDKRVWKVLQDWIDHQQDNGLGNSTIKTRFSLLNKYLFWMKIKIDKRDVENELTFPPTIQDKKYALKLEDIQKILTVASYDKKVLYLCQISSLTRIGELLQLRKKDLDLSTDRITVNLRARTTKKGKERTTFFSREASVLLRVKLKKMDDNDMIWPHTVKILSNAGTMEQDILSQYLKKIGLDMRYETSKYLKISTHSFRAYGITKVKRIDPALAYFLAGQDSKVYMSQYDRLKDDPKELYEAYLKIEPHLMILNPKQDESKEIKEIKKVLDETKAEMKKYKESYDEFQKLSTDKEFRKNQLMPLIENIKKRVKAELRAELLEEIKKEDERR